MANPLFCLLLLSCFCLALRSGVVEGSHALYPEYQASEPSTVGELHRTGYHFQPPKNWINDPNGPMYFNGYYHLFYQYNPKGAVWGNIVWAHSVSKDLINWKALKPAIYPTKPFDINGCWSGSATILPGNRPVMFYTGIDPDNNQVQNVAFPKNISDPYLEEWVKPDYNPVIFPGKPTNASAFRDPSTAWLGKDGLWRTVVGTKHDQRGIADLYLSKDFKTWSKANDPLHSAPGTGMWECPDFYPVAVNGTEGVDTSVVGEGYRHVLKVSLDITRYEYYTVGAYDPEKDSYAPSNSSADDHTGLRYDYGNFYASKTFYDSEKKRRVLWGWSNESDSTASDIAKGWAGVQTIPRTIWLHENGRQLVQWPVKELDELRGKKVSIRGLKLWGGRVFPVNGIQTSEADVEVVFHVRRLKDAEAWDPSWSTDPQVLCGEQRAEVRGGVGPFGLLVLSSGDLGGEQTAVLFRVFKAPNKHVVLMCHDPSRSTTMEGVYKPSFGGFVDIDIAKNRKISLRTLIDNSVVESFGDGGKTVITSRVYPLAAVGSSARLFAFNNGTSDVEISELRAWQMKKANID